jgi:hypothetical protein
VPAVSETLASFTTALAATTYSATVTTVNACKTFSLPINGTTYPGTVSALSLGQTFGDQSAAWQFAIASQGLNLIIDQTVVHIGDEIMLFTYLASTPPAVTTITGLLTTAVAGVTGGASTQ